MMTEAEAWLWVAEAVETRFWLVGLCAEVALCYGRGLITPRVCERMRARIERYLDGRAWAYPMGQDRGARVLAALWLREEALARIPPG